MDLLISVATLRTSLGYDDAEQINAALHSAIVAAGGVLAAKLNTEFERDTKTDKFILRTVMKEGSLERCRVRLSQAFIVTGSVSIKLAETPAEIASADPIAADSYEVDLDKGFVTIYGAPLQNQICHITYDYGFELGTGGDSELYQAVPSWLTDVALNASVLQLYWNNQSYKPQNFTDQEAKSLQTSVDSIMARKIRRGIVADAPM